MPDWLSLDGPRVLENASCRRRLRYADSPAANRDDGAVFQCVAVTLDDLGHHGNALLRRNIREAYEASVRDVVEVDQFTKVGVYRDQDSPCRLSEFQKGPVSGVRAERASFEHIMPVIAKPLRHTTPCASINQKAHYSPTEIVASVSRAMIACA